MFLSFIKNFSAKRVLRKSSQIVKSSEIHKPVKTIGIIIDETYFNDKKALIQELLTYGFEEKNIKVLSFKNRYKKNEVTQEPSFSTKDLSWSGTINKIEVLDFIEKDFDLLINYYEINKSPLMMVTHNSRGLFKAGFTSIDKNLNHLMIKTTMENYKTFTSELIKYLKILNKL